MVFLKSRPYVDMFSVPKQNKLFVILYIYLCRLLICGSEYQVLIRIQFSLDRKMFALVNASEAEKPKVQASSANKVDSRLVDRRNYSPIRAQLLV